MMQNNTRHKVIRKNHSNCLPKVIIAYDTETFRTKLDGTYGERAHTFRLGVAITSEYRNGKQSNVQSHRLLTPSSLWRIICDKTSPQHTTWLVAHNAMFDFIVSELAVRFETGELVIDWPRTKRTRESNNEDEPHCQGMAVIDSPPTIIACRVRQSQGRLVIVDTLNWLPTSLAQIGNWLGYEKLPFPDWNDGDDKWFRYCQRDCEITWRCICALMDYARDNKLGMFAYTFAGQAMHAYRHRFMPHTIFPHTNNNVKQLERSGYFGGRVDAWRIGPINETVYQLDANSLFPSIMQSGEFPYVLHRSHMQPRFTRVLPIIKWEDSIANVALQTSEAIYPKRTDKGIVYPSGRFETTLCGKELHDAYANQRIVGIRSWAEYKCKPLFTLWVDELWQMRQEYKQAGDTMREQLTKRLMNGLYGKFAQRSPLWINANNNKRGVPWSKWREKNTHTNESIHFRMFGWQCQVKREWPESNPPACDEVQADEDAATMADGEIAGTFVAISAFVTAAARMRMNELRRIAQRGNVIYQATDSLFVRKQGYDNLFFAGEISQDRLGAMRLVETADNLIIYGCNDYVLGNKIVISGKAKAIELIEGESINQRKFFTNSLLFNGQAPACVIEKELQWERQQGYGKGIKQPDNSIIPFALEQLTDYQD